MRLQCIGLKLLDVSKWRGRVFRMLRIGKFLLAASWPLTSCTARVWQELKYFAILPAVMFGYAYDYATFFARG